LSTKTSQLNQLEIVYPTTNQLVSWMLPCFQSNNYTVELVVHDLLFDFLARD
jgi:hypothetical protein